MLATSLTAALLGVEAHLVRVEADTASGFPRFTMVGLPDSAVKESEAPLMYPHGCMVFFIFFSLAMIAVSYIYS